VKSRQKHAWLLFGVALHFVGCSCRGTPVNSAIGTLVLEPQNIQLPPSFVGYPRRVGAVIRNTGNASQMARLSTTAPFRVEPETLQIPGGESALISVVLEANSPGLFSEALRIESDQHVLEGSLTGTVASIPKCEPKDSCQEGWFDGLTSQCKYAPRADGLSCGSENRCIQNGRCVRGSCVGTDVDCDDQNLCTTDACEPEAGCLHFSAEAQCQASTNPCKIPRCDPALGCTVVDAEDGLRCGPSDCSTANICLFGECKTVTVTDGAACGSTSPCQQAGQCQNQVCMQPEATELVPAWTVWAQPQREVEWDAIADDSGNLYWRERERDATLTNRHLVSVTAAGARRFNIPVGAASDMTLVENVLVLTLRNAVQGRSTVDGSLLWQTPFEPVLNVRAGSTFRIAPVSRGTARTAYVGIQETQGSNDAGQPFASVLKLSIDTGEVLWRTSFPGSILSQQDLPVDELGYLYGDLAYPSHTYFSLSPLGTVRWNTPNPHREPAATFGGRVYHWDHWISDTSTGAWVNATAPLLSAAGYPRLALGTISYAATDTQRAPACDDPNAVVDATRLELRRVDPKSSEMLWATSLAGPDAGGYSLTNLLLTAKGSVLFSQPADRCSEAQFVLREVSTWGETLYRCRLPRPATYQGEGLLVKQTWVSAISEQDGADSKSGVRAFALPGFFLPEHGWAVSRGSIARDHHPR
jgi:hypothetical protein